MPEPSAPPFRATVVVPTYRRRESTRRLLESLRRQTLPPGEFEVVVSIDGSEDGTREMVTGFDAPYALTGLWHPNQGRARACNVGVAAARGELIVILDDDMEAQPGFVAAHVAAHPPGSRRAVVGAAPIMVDDASPPLARFTARGFNWRQAQLASPGYELRFREAYSGNFSIRRTVLLEVGGFDPDFRVYGHEDYELALRLQRAGVRLHFCADAVADQHYEKEFPSLARDMISRGRTAVLFADKHPDIVETLPLSSYDRAPRRWRWPRSVLLAASRVAPRTTDVVIGAVVLLERIHPAGAARVYRSAIDYFYWVGARAAQRERVLSRGTSFAPAAIGEG